MQTCSAGRNVEMSIAFKYLRRHYWIWGESESPESKSENLRSSTKTVLRFGFSGGECVLTAFGLLS